MRDKNVLVRLLLAAADGVGTYPVLAEHATVMRDAASALLNVPKWIPVSERLPEYDQSVLVVTHGVTRTGWLRDPAYAGKGAAPWNSMGGILSGVTDWQPLPEPPKG